MSNELSGKLQLCRVHLDETHVAEAVLLDARARALEHAIGQIDGRHGTFPRVQRKADAGADADFENLIVGLDGHAPNRLRPAMVQRQAEEQVVNRRHLLVHAFDERRLERDCRQRPCRRVSCGREVFILFSRKEQRHHASVEDYIRSSTVGEQGSCHRKAGRTPTTLSRPIDGTCWRSATVYT